MKHRRICKYLCMVICAAMALGSFLHLLPQKAIAVSTTYTLAELLAQDKLKALGRTQANAAGTALTADWSGSGFAVNVSGDGGTMTVGYRSSYNCFWAVLVDGTQIWRGLLSSSSAGKTFSVTIPAGSHTVSVIKETQISSDSSAYFDLTTLAFGGTIEAAPAKKGLYIEFIGDSYSCGDGALGEYEAGKVWISSHDSATHGFPWYTAQNLNADYSIVARGGIGLFVGLSEQEGTAQKAGMQDIYNYTSGYNQANGEYGFSRQPNVIVVELGANDGILASDQYKTIEYWAELLADFTDQVRSKNPKAAIVFLSHKVEKYNVMRNLVAERASSDPNLYAFHFSHNGNGSAAVNNQKEGHPSAEDHQELAKGLSNYISTMVLPKAAEAQPAYTDIPYYVSENGSDSNSGTSIDTAKLTLTAAVTQAISDNSSFAEGSRLVFYVQGTVLNSSNNSQVIGTRQTLRTANGSKLPILITTYGYSGTKAILDTGHTAKDDGNGSVYATNDITFQNITLQSTTRQYYDGNGVAQATLYRDRNFYSNYNSIVFDNATFAMAGDTPGGNNTGWIVNASPFTASFLPTGSTAAYATVTFKNGDYSNLYFATAVRSNGYSSNGTTITSNALSNHKVIVEEGATVSTLYNRYGTFQAASAEVEIRGGTVNRYIGSPNGNSTTARAYVGDFSFTMSGGTVNDFMGTGNYLTIDGNVDFNMSGGTILGTTFCTAGTSVTITGNINNTIQSGNFLIQPPGSSSQTNGFFFAGCSKVTVANVNNTISGGQFLLEFNHTYTANEATKYVDSGYYFGGSSGANVTGNVTNKISGGSFLPLKGSATPGHCSIYFGQFSGRIQGTLRNEISGGCFDFSGSGKVSSYYFGGRAAAISINRVENVLGVQGTHKGPRFLGGQVLLGAGWGQLGQTATSTGLPEVSACTDTVVLSNTIYGGYFPYAVTAAPTSVVNGSTYAFVKGSVQTDIYGGMFYGVLSSGVFEGSFYGAGAAPVYGHVTTNIHGGLFASIHGSRGGAVHDGVALNIYAMEEYYPLVGSPNTQWGIWACGSGTVSVQTENRSAVKLTLAPQKPADLVLNTPLHSGDGEVSISGGTFPQGLAVDGKTVGEVLALGYGVYDTTTGLKAAYTAGDSSVAGPVAVCSDSVGFTQELVYYVSHSGSASSSYEGTSLLGAKASLRQAFEKIVAHNGGSTVFPVGTSLTIYINGTVVNNDNQQSIGYSQALTTADGKHLLTTVEGYGYDGTTKPVIRLNHRPTNSGSASAYLTTDITFRNVDILSETNAVTNGETGVTSYFCTNKLYAAGCSLTFDNANLLTDGNASGYTKWVVSADHFSTGGINPTAGTEMHGTVCFQNGDYTNLNYVTTVNAGSIWISTGNTMAELPNMHCKVIIGEGAVMSTVFGPVGSMQVGSSTVEVQGGTVNTLYGTGNGTKNLSVGTKLLVSGGTVHNLYGTGSGPSIALSGNVEISVSGGTVHNLYGTGSGNLTNTSSTKQSGSLTLTGDVDITVSGGTVNNYYGTGSTQYASVTVGSTATELHGHVTVDGNVKNNITGGTVNNFCGTGSGHINGRTVMNTVSVTGNVENTITAGTFGGARFLGAGDCVTVSGDLKNTISGGQFTISPVATDQMDAYFFAGRKNVTISNVHNTFSGGQFSILYNAAVDSGFYLGGGSSASITGNVTNKLTGGTFCPKDGTAAGTHGSFFLGQYSGSIGGTLRNEVTAITVDYKQFATASSLYCGPRATRSTIGKMVNIIGDPATGVGPTLTEGDMLLGSGWAQVGVTTSISNSAGYPAVSSTASATGNVVISSKVYGGSFPSSCYGSSTGAETTYQNIVYGSVVTDIYGGSFNRLYGAGGTPVFGHVATNIHGGTFKTICGSGTGKVYDGLTLNIYDMDEGSDPTIYAGGTTGTVSTVTQGRDAVRLTIGPGSMVLSKTITAGFSSTGSATGTTSVAVSGGTYPNGFRIGTVTVKDALAEGYGLVTTAGSLPVTLPDDATVSGTESVTVAALVPVDESLKFSGASLTLYSDLSVNFKANSALFGEDGFTDPYVIFVSGGITTKVTQYKVSGSRYLFAFHDIAPHRIGDTITATPYATKDGVLYAGKSTQYSVSTYCYNMLNTYTGPGYAKLQTLLVDLLNYGATAQLYSGYNTDSLVNRNLTELQLAWGTQTTPALDNSAFSLNYATVEAPSVIWRSAGLYLKDAVTVRLTLETASLEGLTVKVEAADSQCIFTEEDLVPTGTENQYYLYFDKLNAAQMRETILVTAYLGDTPVSNTVSYSIECYIYAKQNDAEIAYLADLVKSMIRYGDSAQAYGN